MIEKEGGKYKRVEDYLEKNGVDLNNNNQIKSFLIHKFYKKV